MLMGYMSILLAFVLSLLRCIYLKVCRVEHVLGWFVAEHENPPSTAYCKLDVSGVPTDQSRIHVLGWFVEKHENPPSTAYCKLDVSGVPTDRTQNNNRTLDQSRIFEEV